MSDFGSFIVKTSGKGAGLRKGLVPPEREEWKTGKERLKQVKSRLKTRFRQRNRKRLLGCPRPAAGRVLGHAGTRDAEGKRGFGA